MNNCITQGALSAWWGGLRQDKSKSPSPPDASPAGSPSSENQVPSETNQEPSDKPERREEASNSRNKDQESVKHSN